MDFKNRIEELRCNMQILKCKDDEISEARLEAMFKKSHGYEDIKVQTTRNIDNMENNLIKAQELQEYKKMLANKCWTDSKIITKIIDTHAKTNDMQSLYMYMLGHEVEDIPLCSGSKNPYKAIDKAIKGIQVKLNFEQEIEKQPPVIQELIRGNKKKCRFCSVGKIAYKKAEADRFIFACNKCKKMFKADRL